MKNIKKINLKKAFLLSTVISLGIAALIAIFIFLFGGFGDVEMRLLVTTLAIGGYSLTGLSAAFLYEKSSYQGLALLGVAISLIAFLYTLFVVWELIPYSEFSSNLFWSVIILAVAISSICLLYTMEASKKVVKIILRISAVFVGVLALMLILLIFGIVNEPGEFYYRLMGVLAVLSILGTITAPILNKFYSEIK